MIGLMVHKADVFRPTKIQNTAQEISGYVLHARCVPCFIQPVSSAEAFYYSQRGLENVHTVYTTDACGGFDRNDVFTHAGSDYHVTGVKNALVRGLYLELTAVQYPEQAKRRLDTEAYP